jgi:hypothetical protein
LAALRGIAAWPAGPLASLMRFLSLRASVAEPSVEVGLVDSERVTGAAEPDRGKIVGRGEAVDGLLGDREAGGDLVRGQQPSLI